MTGDCQAHRRRVMCLATQPQFHCSNPVDLLSWNGNARSAFPRDEQATKRRKRATFEALPSAHHALRDVRRLRLEMRSASYEFGWTRWLRVGRDSLPV